MEDGSTQPSAGNLLVGGFWLQNLLGEDAPCLQSIIETVGHLQDEPDMTVTV